MERQPAADSEEGRARLNTLSGCEGYGRLNAENNGNHSGLYPGWGRLVRDRHGIFEG